MANTTTYTVHYEDIYGTPRTDTIYVPNTEDYDNVYDACANNVPAGCYFLGLEYDATEQPKPTPPAAPTFDIEAYAIVADNGSSLTFVMQPNNLVTVKVDTRHADGTPHLDTIEGLPKAGARELAKRALRKGWQWEPTCPGCGHWGNTANGGMCYQCGCEAHAQGWFDMDTGYVRR